MLLSSMGGAEDQWGKPITFRAPDDGYVSIVIKNAKGETVCSLAKAVSVKKGQQTVKWHVGTTKHWWTGKQREAFQRWRKNFGHVPVPNRPWEVVEPGAYSWEGIWHKGLSLRLRGWAFHGSSQPWDVGQTDRWGGEHGMPAACAADDQRVYLGWTGNEVGRALIAVDPADNGKPIQDVMWSQAGGFTSIQRLAVDEGVVYFVSSKTMAAVDAKTGAPFGGPKLNKRLSEIWMDPAGKPHRLNSIEDGFSARNGKLYLTFSESNLVVQVDVKTGKVSKTFSVKSPGSISAVDDRLIYLASESSKVLALDSVSGKTFVVLAGLTNTDGLAVDRQGNICLTFGFPKPHVAVYSPQGKLLKSMGQGRAGSGPWNRDTLVHSTQIAVDQNGLIWVAEAMHPRRVSVWDPKRGKCIREYFGPTHYGASGAVIHPGDPNIMVGEGCEFRVNPKTGRATMRGLVVAHSMIPQASRFCEGPRGREYLAGVYQGTIWNPRDPRKPKRIEIHERVSEGSYRLRAAIRPEPSVGRTVFWADRNADLKEQPDELSYMDRVLDCTVHHLRVISINTDLTLYGYDIASKSGVQVRVNGFTQCGAPIYDLKNLKQLSSKRGAIPSPDNRLVLSHDHSYFYCHEVKTGRLLWRYANTFSGSGGSHHACAVAQGMIRGAYGIVGSGLLKNSIGALWAIPTNCGEWHLLSEDGYYLSRLFQPDTGKRSWPQARVGANMDNSPPGHGFEDFGGSMTQGKDGELYLQAGKLALWNLGLKGLGQIQSLKGGTIQVGTDDIREARTSPVLNLK
jgi:hypothetical protein|tara:strand:- start:583 stop:2955 length:2373 start_codon:yes stop_codon:yes gene_type:complete